MPDRTRMSITAKIFIAAVVLTGSLAAAAAFTHWESQDLIRFLCYFALSILASRLKVTLPGLTGSLSVLFIFIPIFPSAFKL